MVRERVTGIKREMEGKTERGRRAQSDRDRKMKPREIRWSDK